MSKPALPIGGRYELRFAKVATPEGFTTAYRVEHDGEPIGYVASDRYSPIVPRHRRPTTRNGRSQVTRWYAAQRLADLAKGPESITSTQRHDAGEQLVDERRRER